jgi:hypothetical protein
MLGVAGHRLSDLAGAFVAYGGSMIGDHPPECAFTVVDGLARGSTFTIPAGRSAIGRVAGTAVTLPDATVSRRHAEIDRSAAGIAIRDLASANGTYVNGARLHGARELNDGDEVRIGAVVLRFSIVVTPTGTARTPPPPIEGSTSPTGPRSFGDVQGPVHGVGLGHETTVRAVAFGSGTDDALIAAMAANLPRRSIAAANMTDERALPQSTYQLLDRRILAIALRFLDEDLAVPFLTGLGKYRALLKAAHDTRANPEQGEVLVTLADPHRITSTQHPYVALVIDDREIARVSFEISLVFGLFETAVAVRRGAIESVECEACSLTIILSLVGWTEPLLHREVQLPVRLPVRPPMMIPLAGSA